VRTRNKYAIYLHFLNGCLREATAVWTGGTKKELIHKLIGLCSNCVQDIKDTQLIYLYVLYTLALLLNYTFLMQNDKYVATFVILHSWTKIQDTDLVSPRNCVVIYHWTKWFREITCLFYCVFTLLRVKITRHISVCDPYQNCSVLKSGPSYRPVQTLISPCDVHKSKTTQMKNARSCVFVVKDYVIL